jgi:hypothetical protein
VATRRGTEILPKDGGVEVEHQVLSVQILSRLSRTDVDPASQIEASSIITGASPRSVRFKGSGGVTHGTWRTIVRPHVRFRRAATVFSLDTARACAAVANLALQETWE